MKKPVKIILIIIAIICLYLIGSVAMVFSYSSVDEKRECDVAVVLGAATYFGNVSNVYRARLDHSVELYNDGYVSKIIATGGMGIGNETSDAYAAKQYLIDQGIPENDILIEEKSTVTQENVVNAKAVMEENGLKTALIVSDPLHMRRAVSMAKDAGIEAFSSPTCESAYVSWKTKLPFLLRETGNYIGYRWYRIFGAI